MTEKGWTVATWILLIMTLFMLGLLLFVEVNALFGTFFLFFLLCFLTSASNDSAEKWSRLTREMAENKKKADALRLSERFKEKQGKARMAINSKDEDDDWDDDDDRDEDDDDRTEFEKLIDGDDDDDDWDDDDDDWDDDD